MRSVSRKTAYRIIYWNAVAAAFLVSLSVAAFTRRQHQFDTLIQAAGQRHGVHPRLISAVIWRESRFDPNALGAAKEIGLMQVTGGAAQDWAKAQRRQPFSVEELWDPATNIDAGTWYLARAILYWQEAGCRDPLPFALAEYNAGRARAREWAKESRNDADDFLAVIEFRSTRRYVRDILKRYRGRA